jgi:peptidoglycan/LPS O-acetylase OafA/YrhL
MCNWRGLDGGALAWLEPDVGYNAVVIFFVLSGYVICATLSRNGTALDYGIKRASRIYSVAAPAVLLTLLIDLIIRYLHLPAPPAHYAAYQLDKPWLYTAIALTFSGHFWGLAEPAFSNGPYWSLDYEVWYYVAFGIAVFAQGFWRWAGLLLVLAIMGPNIWLLLPIWLSGVAVCRLQQSRPLPRSYARMMVAASIALFLVVKTWQLEDAINAEAQSLIATWFAFPPDQCAAGRCPVLKFSRWFLGDYLVGILTMALIYALGSADLRFPRFLQQPIVGLAKLSFSLYLMHYPLLKLLGALFPHGWVAIFLSLGSALAFGAVFEPQKDRLRRLLTLLLARRPPDAAGAWLSAASGAAAGEPHNRRTHP